MTSSETIHDPNQRDLWAPKPGRSFLREFPAARTIHLTLKMNVDEGVVLRALHAEDWATRRAAFDELYEDMGGALTAMLEGCRADLAPTPPPENYKAPQPSPAAPSGVVPVHVVGDEECLSCQ